MNAVLDGLTRLADRPALELAAGKVFSGTDVLADNGIDESVRRLANLARSAALPLTVAFGSADRVAVLGGGDGPILAAWAAGATAILGPASHRPAAALAFLERCRPTHAVLPTAVATDLLDHPALRLADLGPLRALVCDGPPMSDSDRERWQRDHGIEISTLEPVADDEPADLAERMSYAASTALHGVDLRAAVTAVDRLGHAALLAMALTLHSPGQIEPRHARLVDRWRAALTRHGITSADKEAVTSAFDDAEAAWRTTAGSAVTVDYIRANAERLGELLAGTCSPMTLLFPEGRVDLAAALYRESAPARYQIAAAAAAVAAIATVSNRRPVRLLEVGGGTGATTERILPALAEINTDYLFTDVSTYFVQHARQRFPGLRYGLADITTSLPEQGYAAGSADIVIAGGVLNAATDTDAALRGLAGILRPGGWLVLTEPTTEELSVLISQAFLLSPPRDGRAATGATFLSLPQWRDALDSAGLRRVVELPEPGHPLARLGHHVFVTRTRSTTR